jgi:hypothetical protein
MTFLIRNGRKFLNKLRTASTGKYGGLLETARGEKKRQALLAGNVKQLQEIRLNEDLLLKI